MPFPAFIFTANIIILSLVCIEVFALANQPIQALLENECNKEEKCMLKQLNHSQCLIPGKCDLCGITKADEINYAALRKALQCTGQKDELKLHNKAGGLAVLSSYETPNPDLSWGICEIEPDASRLADPDSGKSLLEKVNSMSQCKEKDCNKQDVNFRLCSLDNDEKSMECFDGDGVRSYPVEEGVHALYFDEDISCKECLLQMSSLDGGKVLPMGCFPISVMPRKSVRKDKLKRFAEEIENGSVSNETSSMDVTALAAVEVTASKPDVGEKVSSPEATKDAEIQPKPTKASTAAPKPKHMPMRPMNAPPQKPKMTHSNPIQKPKAFTPRHTPAPKPETKKPATKKPATKKPATKKPAKERVISKGAKAAKKMGKAAVHTTLRTSKRPIISTKRSLKPQHHPLAMTKHIEVDPMHKRPTTSSTKSFDDMWKEKMHEFEEKKKDRFEAFKSKNDPPSMNDPYIKIPPEDTFESKNNGCDGIKWSLVLQGALFLWMCLCG